MIGLGATWKSERCLYPWQGGGMKWALMSFQPRPSWDSMNMAQVTAALFTLPLPTPLPHTSPDLPFLLLLPGLSSRGAGKACQLLAPSLLRDLGSSLQFLNHRHGLWFNHLRVQVLLWHITHPIQSNTASVLLNSFLAQ